MVQMSVTFEEDTTPTLYTEMAAHDLSDSSDSITTMALLYTDNVITSTGYELFNISNSAAGNLSKDISTMPPKTVITHAVDHLGLVTVPLFLIIGLIGNTVTVAVMRTKAFRVMAISYILIALSASDTTLNVMVIFNKRFFIKFVGTDLRALDPIGCKLFFWLWRTAKMTSSWFIVLIAIDRFIAVWFPMQVREINNKTNALRGIALVYFVIGGFNAVWVVFSDVVRRGYCLPNVPGEGYSPSTIKGFVITGTSLYTHIPVFIIFILNTLTVVKLVTQSRRRMKMSQDESVNDLKDRTYKMSVMLLGVSIAFLLLVVPSSLMHVVSVHKGINIFQATDTPTVMAREIISCLEQLNYSINFYLYVMCSERFRVEVGLLFHLTCLMDEKYSNSDNRRRSALKMKKYRKASQRTLSSSLPSPNIKNTCTPLKHEKSPYTSPAPEVYRQTVSFAYNGILNRIPDESVPNFEVRQMTSIP